MFTVYCIYISVDHFLFETFVYFLLNCISFIDL